MKIKYGLLILASLFFLQESFANNVNVPNTVITCTVNSCPPIAPILKTNEKLTNQIIVFQTANTPEFMLRSTHGFADHSNGAVQQINIDELHFKQAYPIIGFGGSFSDSAAILYKNMSPLLQKALINSYFSATQGIAYSLGRVPMASTDFSCRTDSTQKTVQPSLNNCSKQSSLYAYEDVPDHFSLQMEDLNFKIPMIKDANEILKINGDAPLRLFASPWSAPSWMKTNASMLQGSINPCFQKNWAEYFIQFLEAYKQNQIKFWGVTVQNEPDAMDKLNRRSVQWWQSMFYTSAEEGDFVKNYLGPRLEKYSIEYGSKINLIIHDDQITSINNRVSMLTDPQVAQYVDGVGLHWYLNLDLFFGNLDKTSEMLKRLSDRERFILGTEASAGYGLGPLFGSWLRGEAYAHDIINDLNHSVSGWTDWNLLLDMHGGPNWAKNYVDAPILVDLQKQTFYKQPMYFYLGHFSKFIRPDAKLLSPSLSRIFTLETVACKVPQHGNLPETIVIVVLNRSLFAIDYFIKNTSKRDAKKYINMHIPARAIQTIIYKST